MRRGACAQHITHLHAAIRSALDAFAAEAAALRTGGALGAAALAALVERHRFLRAVCAFHSASEDDVVFPAARSAPVRRSRAAPFLLSFLWLFSFTVKKRSNYEYLPAGERRGSRPAL